MTDETRELVRQRLSQAQSRLANLKDDLALSSVQSDIEEISTSLRLLPGDIEKLRARGYVFKSFLEKKVSALDEEWQRKRNEVAREVRTRVRELAEASDKADEVVRGASAFRESTVDRAESAVEGLEQRISGARNSVESMYDNLKQNVWTTSEDVKSITWMFDQVDEACFGLRPGEDLVAVCNAQLLETKKDGPSGLLYLTDERLIFERKEKVAKKKVLFIATEKEMVQEVVLDMSIGLVENTKATDKGLFGGKELLELLFAREADIDEATLRLKGAKNEDWAAAIGRIQSGEIAKERTKPKDEAVVEAAQAAPSKCPYCGATLEVVVVRGMREISCDYCGSVIRL